VFAERARKLLVEDNVAVLVGCWTSGSRKRVAEECREHDRLLLYPASYEGLEESPYVVYLGSGPNQLLEPVPRWAYADLKKRKFFLVGSESVFSLVSHAILRDELKDLRAEVAGEATVPLGEADFTALARRIKECGADMVLNTLDGTSNVALAQALRKAGVRPPEVPTVWFNVGEHELRYYDVPRMVGDYTSSSYFQSLPGQANQDWVARFRARYGPGRPVNDAMEAAYEAVWLWKQAVEAAGTTETAAVRQALKGREREAPEGLIKIDPRNQHAWRMARIGQITKGGAFRVVWQSPGPVEPVPFPPSRTRAEWQQVLDDVRARLGGWERHQR
jgi:urea transport system substrate-binding protein